MAIRRTQMPRVQLKALSVALVFVALRAARGGGGSGGQPAGSTKVTLTEFKFDPSTITVPHGKVVLCLVKAGCHTT